MAAATGQPTDVLSAFLECSRVENSTFKSAFSSRPDEHAVLVTPFNDFVAEDIPSVFRTKEQSSESDPEKKTLLFELINPDDLTLCIDKPRAKWFPQNKGCILKFEDDLQLTQLAHGTLLNRPILMIARIKYTSLVETDKRDFLVLINTKHPDIQGPMQKALDDVMERARRGNSLAIEFDFSNVIVPWIRKLIYQWEPSSPSSLSTSTPLTLEAKIPVITCEGAQLVVTNTTPMACQFRNRDDIKVFICCLPCCLLTCPCYRIHRYLTVHDKRVVFSADITFLPLARKYDTEEDSLKFLKNTLMSTCYEDAETVADLKVKLEPEHLASYLQMNELMMSPPENQ